MRSKIPSFLLIDALVDRCLEVLQEQDRADDGGRLREVARELAATEGRLEMRRMEYAAYGLPWLEIAHGLRFDLRHSLEHEVPHGLLGARGSDAPAGQMMGIEGSIDKQQGCGILGTG